ncbi:MAG: hypothetical protein V3V35_05865 [Dehalococcoidia bacterium]
MLHLMETYTISPAHRQQALSLLERYFANTDGQPERLVAAFTKAAGCGNQDEILLLSEMADWASLDRMVQDRRQGGPRARLESDLEPLRSAAVHRVLRPTSFSPPLQPEGLDPSSPPKLFMLETVALMPGKRLSEYLYAFEHEFLPVRHPNMVFRAIWTTPSGTGRQFEVLFLEEIGSWSRWGEIIESGGENRARSHWSDHAQEWRRQVAFQMLAPTDFSPLR